LQIQQEDNTYLSDEEFLQQSQNIKFERTKKGKIIVMASTGLDANSASHNYWFCRLENTKINHQNFSGTSNGLLLFGKPYYISTNLISY